MLYNWIRHISFAFPWVFALFALLPLLIFWYTRKYNRQQAAIRVSSAHAFTVTSFKNYFRHLPFILRLLAISALVLAMARPQQRNDQEHAEGEGIDIVLCMDVSGSMGSADIPPSRMDVAKEVAEKFVQGRPVDRIGLVVFSGESFTQCPITTDRTTVITQIRQLVSKPPYLIDGTVIGEGLATAADRLSESKAKSKVIILITDGKEDPPPARLIDPLTALEIARAEGVKVYTIGMGALPTAPELGTGSAQRNPAIDFIDVELLRNIATQTGGRYFRAQDKEALEEIYRQIDQLEKSEVEITSYKRFRELFFPFVFAALGLLFAEIILRLTWLKKFP